MPFVRSACRTVEMIACAFDGPWPLRSLRFDHPVLVAAHVIAGLPTGTVKMSSLPHLGQLCNLGSGISLHDMAHAFQAQNRHSCSVTHGGSQGSILGLRTSRGGSAVMGLSGIIQRRAAIVKRKKRGTIVRLANEPSLEQQSIESAGTRHADR